MSDEIQKTIDWPFTQLEDSIDARARVDELERALAELSEKRAVAAARYARWIRRICGEREAYRRESRNLRDAATYVLWAYVHGDQNDVQEALTFLDLAACRADRIVKREGSTPDAT